MRVEIQSNVSETDPFLTSFEQALQTIVGAAPTVKGCPTLRVGVTRPSEGDLEQKFTLKQANPNRCAFFTFDLFDTLGRQRHIPQTNDGTLRAYHYALGDGSLQLSFDDLPGFDGNTSQVADYAKSIASFILAQLED